MRSRMHRRAAHWSLTIMRSYFATQTKNHQECACTRGGEGGLRRVKLISVVRLIDFIEVIYRAFAALLELTLYAREIERT